VPSNCPWKVNVRELASFIERAVIVTRGEELEVPVAMIPPSDTVIAVSSPSLRLAPTATMGISNRSPHGSEKAQVLGEFGFIQRSDHPGTEPRSSVC